MLISRADGQAIRLPHGRNSNDCDRDVEVLDQPTYDGKLLRVLFAEVCDVRPDDLEQLQDDGRDAPEMSGPVSTAAMLGERAGVNRARRRTGVHLPSRWGEDDVNAKRLAEREIGVDRPRIPFEVVGTIELKRIDENAHHDASAIC